LSGAMMRIAALASSMLLDRIRRSEPSKASIPFRHPAMANE